MAIRIMVSKDRYESDTDNIEVVRNYPGHEEGVIYHYENCPKGLTGQSEYNQTEPCNGKHCTGPFSPLYMKTMYEGKVLEVGEHNYYDDSDFFAIIWDDKENRPREIEYASTRGWSYPNDAWVDATEEILEKYKKYQDEKRKIYEEKLAEERKQKEIELAKTPQRDRRVRVVRGRKVPIGTEGLCFYLCDSQWGVKIGIATTDAKDDSGRFKDVAWTYAKNCEVIDWEQYLTVDK